MRKAGGRGGVPRGVPPAAIALFGWLLPGGAYLPARRYCQFALALALVAGATAAGLALGGANLAPQPADVAPLDSFSAAVAWGGTLARALAGGPWLLAQACDYARNFSSGPAHEYGTTLLTLAGLFNLLALADGLAGRKAKQA